MNRKNIIIISILIILISGGLLYPKMQLKYYRDKAIAADSLGNFNEALTYYKKIIEKENNKEIAFRLGELLTDSSKAGVDNNSALDYYVKSSEWGKLEANYFIAKIYLNPDFADCDTIKAIDFFSKESGEEQKNSYYKLFTFYYLGNSVDKDINKSLTYLEKAADLGNPKAEYFIGRIKLLGEEGITKDPEDGIRWLKKAINNGYMLAAALLGYVYTNGINVPINSEDGYKYTLMAAEAGCKDSYNNLGAIYSSGRGTIRDLDKAFYWYNKAAEENDIYGQLNVGISYYYGTGINEDKEKGLSMIKTCADRGLKEAKDFLRKLNIELKRKHDNEIVKCDWISCNNGYYYENGIPRACPACHGRGWLRRGEQEEFYNQVKSFFELLP